MKPDRTDEGRFTDRGRGLGTVTEEMIRSRAEEIAVINGRSKRNVLSADIEQATRELRDGATTESTKAENVPEADRWAPEGGSPGRKAETLSASDEQTFAERLVEEGVADAEHDQEVQATKDSLQREKRR